MFGQPCRKPHGPKARWRSRLSLVVPTVAAGYLAIHGRLTASH
jgi:hypothetical protein